MALEGGEREKERVREGRGWGARTRGKCFKKTSPVLIQHPGREREGEGGRGRERERETEREEEVTKY